MGRACTVHGERRNAHTLLVGSPRCKWVDNIKMDLGEREFGGRG
jgi:hypothetical protein